jgi:hypothetical protein
MVKRWVCRPPTPAGTDVAAPVASATIVLSASTTTVRTLIERVDAASFQYLDSTSIVAELAETFDWRM